MMKLKNSRTKQHKKLLLNYKKFTANQRKWFLENLSEDFIKYIVEILININVQNIGVSESGLKVLEDYKKIIVKLLSPHLSIEKRRKLIQTGDFLHVFMIHLVSPILKNLISLHSTASNSNVNR